MLLSQFIIAKFLYSASTPFLNRGTDSYFSVKPVPKTAAGAIFAFLDGCAALVGVFCIGSKGWGPLGADSAPVPAAVADTTTLRLELGVERVGMVEGRSGTTAIWFDNEEMSSV